MAEAMAEDHILSWSRPGDLVLDPFCGAGTTCKMALVNDRHYLGMEIHKPYHKLAIKRLENAREEHRRKLDSYFLTGMLESSPVPLPEDATRSRRPTSAVLVAHGGARHDTIVTVERKL